MSFILVISSLLLYILTRFDAPSFIGLFIYFIYFLNEPNGDGAGVPEVVGEVAVTGVTGVGEVALAGGGGNALPDVPLVGVVAADPCDTPGGGSGFLYTTCGDAAGDGDAMIGDRTLQKRSKIAIDARRGSAARASFTCCAAAISASFATKMVLNAW